MEKYEYTWQKFYKQNACHIGAGCMTYRDIDRMTKEQLKGYRY